MLAAPIADAHHSPERRTVRKKLMKLCPMLLNDINLEPASLQPCCDVHGCEVPAFPFSGGKVDMQAYAAHIANCLRRLQEKDDRLCRGCPSLREIPDAQVPDLKIEFKTVSINAHRYLCNCKCVYCELWKHRERGLGYPVLPVLKSLASQQALAANCFFSWGGGEPSILKDFEEASLWVTRRGFWQNVHTNALRFSPAIAFLLQERRGEINISLDSGTAETYQKIKGIDGFAAVTGSLGRYAEAAGDSQAISLKYIIFETNNSIPEITRFFDLCVQFGIKRVQFSLDFREVNGSGPSEKTLLAAAFFASRAAALGLSCTPFFITPKYLEKIAALQKEYFPAR